MIAPLTYRIGDSVVYASPGSTINPRFYSVEMEYPAVFAILLLRSNVVKGRGQEP